MRGDRRQCGGKQKSTHLHSVLVLAEYKCRQRDSTEPEIRLVKFLIHAGDVVLKLSHGFGLKIFSLETFFHLSMFIHVGEIRATRKEVYTKTKENVHGCSEGGH